MSGDEKELDRSRFAELLALVDELRGEVASLRAENSELRVENAELKQRIKELEGKDPEEENKANNPTQRLDKSYSLKANRSGNANDRLRKPGEKRNADNRSHHDADAFRHRTKSTTPTESNSSSPMDSGSNSAGGCENVLSGESRTVRRCESSMTFIAAPMAKFPQSPECSRDPNSASRFMLRSRT